MHRYEHSRFADRKKRTASIKKYVGLVLLAGVVLVLVYVFLFGDYGVYRIWKQRQEIAQLERRIEELRLQKEELDRQIHFLKSDPQYIEKIAREEYGLVKEGEILYKMVPSPDKDERGKTEAKNGSARK